MTASFRLQPLTGLLLGSIVFLMAGLGVALAFVSTVTPHVAIPQGTATGVAKPDAITAAYVQALAKDWLSYLYTYNAANFTARSVYALNGCGPGLRADLAELLDRRQKVVRQTQQTRTSTITVGTPTVRNGLILVPFSSESTIWYGALQVGTASEQGHIALQTDTPTPRDTLLAVVDMELTPMNAQEKP